IDQTLETGGQQWFDQALQGRPVTSSISSTGENVNMVVARPVQGTDGTISSVVAADIDVRALLGFLTADYARTGRVIVLDANGRVLLTSDMEGAQDDAALLSDGALQKAQGDLARLRGGTSSGPTTRHVAGHADLAGYQPGPQGLGWTIVAQEDEGEALSLAANLRHVGIALLLAGVVLLILAASLFARREVRR